MTVVSIKYWLIASIKKFENPSIFDLLIVKKLSFLYFGTPCIYIFVYISGLIRDIYIYVYIPNSCNLQSMDSLSLFYHETIQKKHCSYWLLRYDMRTRCCKIVQDPSDTNPTRWFHFVHEQTVLVTHCPTFIINRQCSLHILYCMSKKSCPILIELNFLSCGNSFNACPRSLAKVDHSPHFLSILQWYA